MSDEWKPKHNPWLVALTVTLATFMEVLDTSIANVALPHIAGGLGAGQSEATWVISCYLVSNAIVLPISGYIATLVGRKRFYMTSVAIFGISSLLCGIAPSLPLLLLFRVLQGLGGGGLATSEQAILADTFEPAKLGQAFALYGLAVVLAPAIGPLLGGWITDNFSWRWIFFINVPVAILSIYLTNHFVEDPPRLKAEMKKLRSKASSIDYMGFVLTAVAFGSLEVVLDKGQEDDWFGSPFITTFIVLAVAGIIALIFWELWEAKKGNKPIIDLSLYKNRTFSISFTLMFVLGIVLYGTTLLIPQLLQTLMGYTATSAGEALSLGGIATLVCMPLVGFLISKIDARYLLAFGFSVSGVAIIHMMNINLEMSANYAATLRFYQATSLGFLFIPLQTLSYTDMPEEKNNDVSGLTNLARNVGGSVGTSLVATMLARQSQKHQVFLAAHLTPSDGLVRSTTQGIQGQLFAGGFAHAQTSMGALAQLYAQLSAQASLLAYIDVIEIFAIASLIVVPFVFLMKKAKPGTVAMH
jgi:DHA2 family multidrug resistance protein